MAIKGKYIIAYDKERVIKGKEIKREERNGIMHKRLVAILRTNRIGVGDRK